ncbi:MAG: SixA phosphatase family protein [Bacteroidales bacterium]
MKTVYIIRHAKSSWDFPHLSDHERPLLEKGKKRTRLINEYLIRHHIQVDLIITSHAVRAYETAKIIARAIGYPPESIRVDRMIYHANAERMTDQFYDLPDSVNSIMLVGHNPTFTNFANMFLDKKIDWLPTSAVVCVDFFTDKWVEVPAAKHKTKFVVTPKEIKKSKKN